MGARTLRLPAKGVGHAAAHPRVPHGVEALHEAKGAVVERVARQGGVVGVHVALAVAHAEPFRDQGRLPLAHLSEHLDKEGEPRHHSHHTFHLRKTMV